MNAFALLASGSLMTPPHINVSLDVDEMAILPEKSSVEELLAGSESCRAQLLPEVMRPASVIAKGAVYSVAGSPLPDWWEADPEIAMRSVNLFRIKGAHYFPDYGVVIDQEGRALRSSMFHASYVTPDLLKLPHVTKNENEVTFTPPETFGLLPRAAITMPWGAIHNYGHFLIDCLSSIPCLTGNGLDDYGFVFPALKQWHRDHLRLLGVVPMELPEKYYHIEDAIFTDCMASFLLAPNHNLRLVPQVERSALGCKVAGDRKIYLSRRDNPKRQFLSEQRLEAILASRGFEIIQPENMPVCDQIELFSSAAVVVGCTGAAFANALYCAPGSVIVEIQPRTMDQPWVRNICVMMGLKWAPYYCDSREPDKAVVYGGQVRPSVGIAFDFDLDEFLGYLDEVTGT